MASFDCNSVFLFMDYIYVNFLLDNVLLRARLWWLERFALKDKWNKISWVLS